MQVLCVVYRFFRTRVIYTYIYICYVNNGHDHTALSYHQLFHPIEHFPTIFSKSVSFDRCCPTRLAYFQASIFHNINERISSVRKWMSKVRVTFHGKWRDKKRRPRLAALLFFLFTPFCFFAVSFQIFHPFFLI